MPVDLAAELLPLTVPEVRRLVWRLVWARAPDPDTVLAWSRAGPASPVAAPGALLVATPDRLA